MHVGQWGPPLVFGAALLRAPCTPHLGSVGRLRLRVDHVHDLLVQDVVRAADVAGGGLAAHLVQALPKAWVVIGHALEAVLDGLQKAAARARQQVDVYEQGAECRAAGAARIA
jgi:hypothetical protein